MIIEYNKWKVNKREENLKMEVTSPEVTMIRGFWDEAMQQLVLSSWPLNRRAFSLILGGCILSARSATDAISASAKPKFAAYIYICMCAMYMVGFKRKQKEQMCCCCSLWSLDRIARGRTCCDETAQRHTHTGHC